LCEIAEYFRGIKDKYIASGVLDPNVFNIDTNVLSYQIPGGMLSNLMSQLKQTNNMDKYNDVLKEVPKVREDLGYPPLVTPSSQFVGTQAVFNVISGSRYKMIPNEIKDYVSGRYGRPSVPISEEIKKKIIGDEEVITCRPADLIEPQLESLKLEMNEYYEQEEDVLSYAVFPQVAMKFFKDRQAKKYGIDSSLADKGNKTYPI
jgi:oxaloacetate decarboxylase alpha subunit